MPTVISMKVVILRLLRRRSKQVRARVMREFRTPILCAFACTAFFPANKSHAKSQRQQRKRKVSLHPRASQQSDSSGDFNAKICAGNEDSQKTGGSCGEKGANARPASPEYVSPLASAGVAAATPPSQKRAANRRSLRRRR